MSIYLYDNPQLLFLMSGFKVWILPKIWIMGREQYSLKDAVWNLTNKQLKEQTAQAFLHISGEGAVQYSCHMCACCHVLAMGTGVQQFNNHIQDATWMGSSVMPRGIQKTTCPVRNISCVSHFPHCPIQRPCPPTEYHCPVTTPLACYGDYSAHFGFGTEARARSVVLCQSLTTVTLKLKQMLFPKPCC